MFFYISWPLMSSLLNESIIVWIHSGGVPVSTECVGDHEAKDSIVH